MQSTIFQNAQRIIAQVLAWVQTSASLSISERIEDTFQNGVCNAELNSMSIIGKDIDPTLSDFFHVEVQTGVAYINGERAAILNFPATFNATNPSQTTNDGTGNFVSTPQSTGSYNIPLTAGSINYIYLAYLNTVDTSVFTLNDVTLAKQFYKGTDGYQIVVNTTGINPNSLIYILLGQVNLTGTNQAVSSNISTVNRPLYKSLPLRIGITTNNLAKTDRPSSYAIGSNSYFLDDHIKSVGTGIVSPINAHGISLNDLGVNIYDNAQFHRQHEHQNGIIAGTPVNAFPIASAFYPQIITVFPGPPDDHIIVKPLSNIVVGSNIVEEVAVVNGVAYTPLEFGAVAGYTITFTGKPVGVYYIYFDGTTFDVTQTSIVGDITKLQLGTVTWSIVGVHGTLSNFVDNRAFGTLDILERWKAPGGRPQNPQAGHVGFDLNTSSMEFYTGTTWAQPVTNLSNNLVPTGALLPFAGSSAPAGFLMATGGIVSQTSFAALFAVIGITYNTGGEGAGNFRLPNLSGFVPAGTGGSLGLGLSNTTGEITHTLTTPEMPSHSHSAADSGHSHGVSDPGHHHSIVGANEGGHNGGQNYWVGSDSGNNINTQTAGTGIGVNSGNANISVGNTGGGAGHNNVQPTIGVNYIIKT